MEIIRVITGQLRTNTYIVLGDDFDCFIIDPGGSISMIEEVLDERGVICKAVLLTHEHFDHCLGVANFQEKGAMIYAHENAVRNMENNLHKLSTRIQISMDEFSVDTILHDGDVFEMCGYNVEVIHTPGHTSGSVCYKVGDVIFSGDTLFLGSIGRTDLPTGNQKEIISSIKEKLFTLKEEFRVLPGHGEETSLYYEKATNRYVN